MHIERIANFPIEENTYVLRDASLKSCIVVDPFCFDTIQEYLGHQKLVVEYIFLTHEHYDHIGAVNELRASYPACKVVCSRTCSDRIIDARKNMSAYFAFQLAINERYRFSEEYLQSIEPYECLPADIVFDDSLEIIWRDSHKIVCFATPGHTDSCVCILFDNSILFSGDTLLRDDPTCTKLPTGSKKDWYEKTVPQLVDLDPIIKVLPGHGEAFILGQRELRRS